MTASRSEPGCAPAIKEANLTTRCEHEADNDARAPGQILTEVFDPTGKPDVDLDQDGGKPATLREAIAHLGTDFGEARHSNAAPPSP